jgi:hypothetical protein
MADRVYLSLWMDEFSTERMLSLWAVALAEFPVSSILPGIRELTAYPFHWGEAPALKQSFQEGVSVADALALATEFLHDDYAYEVDLNWDVWVPREAGRLDQWEKVALPVSVACLGPEFDAPELDAPGLEAEDTQDRPHLLLDLGLDSLFLPEDVSRDVLEEALEGIAETCFRENIAQLLNYVQRLEKSLPVARRVLWESSGEDLAARIRLTYGQ